MSYEQKPGGGSLFKAEKKSDKAPDYTGEIVDLNGKKFRLAAWVKEGKRGKFFSLKLSEFDAKYQQVGTRVAVTTTTTETGNELPF